MGFFTRDVVCPYCGEPGAQKSLFGGVRCPNRACGYFDAELMQLRQLEPGASSAAAQPSLARNPRTGEAVPVTAPAGRFSAGAYAVDIQYTNFRGERKVFRGDRRTLRRRGRHFSLRVEPTGRRIALDPQRIANRSQVERLINEWPSASEERILNYHDRRGSTSDLCERLKRKYPQWTPVG